MSNNTHSGTCMICRESPTPVEHFNFYVIGSEGLNCCSTCKMYISNYIRQLMSLSSKVYVKGFKSGRGANNG